MKIGILTHYFNSKNCGGLLQAYALTKFLNELYPNSTVQIPYNKENQCKSLDTKENGYKNKFKNKKIDEILFMILYKSTKVFNKKFNKKYFKELELIFSERKSICKNFELSIPHIINKEYDDNNIFELNSEIDVFIVGSDQVWNPNWFNKPFYLDFANTNKLKVAYAASMGVNLLSEKEKCIMIPLIKKFKFISVREQTVKNILSKDILNDMSVVVDPVLLLNENEWNRIAVSKIKNRKYIYSYLLGERKINRDLTVKISKKIKLSIASTPYIHMWYNSYDKNFGDIKIQNLGPKEFLGLIRDSEMVITDSFHAVLFSIIFKKKFVVLKRNIDKDNNSMNSRIIDLLEELGLSDRIVEDESKINESFLNKKIEYEYANRILKEKRNKSIDFILNALKEEK